MAGRICEFAEFPLLIVGQYYHSRLVMYAVVLLFVGDLGWPWISVPRDRITEGRIEKLVRKLGVKCTKMFHARYL